MKVTPMKIGSVEMQEIRQDCLLAIGEGKTAQHALHQRVRGKGYKADDVRSTVNDLVVAGVLAYNDRGFELTTKGEKVLRTLKDLKGKK